MALYYKILENRGLRNGNKQKVKIESKHLVAGTDISVLYRAGVLAQ